MGTSRLTCVLGFLFLVVALNLLLASGLFATITLHLVQLEDGRVVNQAVDGGYRHARIGEHVVPAGERLVGGDYVELKQSFWFFSTAIRRGRGIEPFEQPFDRVHVAVDGGFLIVS